jgi:N-methylhydantoinase A
MPEVVVPTFPGVTSAMGLLFVDPLDDFSWAHVRRQDEIDLVETARLYGEMEERVVTSLARQGVDRSRVTVERSIDLRYIGQLHSVTVPLAEVSEGGFQAAIAAFHNEHLRQYRYSHPEWLVESSTLRVSARGQREKPDLRAVASTETKREPLSEREREVHFEGHGWVTTQVTDRSALGRDARISGPCVIEELDSTIVLPPGTSATVDAVGNIVITLDENGEDDR